jgi:IrrE N-terminal-like domain
MSLQPQPSLGQAAKMALEYRVRNGIAQDAQCDIYELIAGQGLELRFMEVKSLEGFYLSDGTFGQINVCAFRPAGLQRFTAAHELGHHVFGHGSTFDLALDLSEKNFSAVKPEERLAELFARYLLMPRRAVHRGISNIGASPQTLEPEEGYRVAAWLGVGYTSLLHQMRWSLSLLDHDRFEKLLTVKPQTIKQALAPTVGKFGRNELWPCHASWHDSHLHVEIGDVITGIKSKPDGILTAMGNGCFQVTGIGNEEVPLLGGGSVQVSACRKEFVGFYQYRYLPEPEDA